MLYLTLGFISLFDLNEPSDFKSTLGIHLLYGFMCVAQQFYSGIICFISPFMKGGLNSLHCWGKPFEWNVVITTNHKCKY